MGNETNRWVPKVFTLRVGSSAYFVGIGGEDSYLTIPPNLSNAVDAVYNTAGQIVCRINQTTVTDPDCVPIDLFGRGNISTAARSYVTVHSGRNQGAVSTPSTNDQAPPKRSTNTSSGSGPANRSTCPPSAEP